MATSDETPRQTTPGTSPGGHPEPLTAEDLARTLAGAPTLTNVHIVLDTGGVAYATEAVVDTDAGVVRIHARQTAGPPLEEA